MKQFLKMFFLILVVHSTAQKDSLYKALLNCSVNDSAVIYNNLASIYRLSNGDSALLFAKKGLLLSKLVNNKFEEASAENEIGIQSHVRMKYDVALTHYLKAIKLYQSTATESENSATKAMASTYQNIGKIHYDQARYQMALKYFALATDYNKKVNNLKGLAGLYNNIAIIHSTLKDNSKSISYHLRSLEIKSKLNDSLGIASTYGGLAVVYYNLKQYIKAIEYNEKKILIDGRYGNTYNIEYTYNNIGGCYFALNNYEKAQSYYEKGIVIAKNNKNYYGLADLYLNESELCEKTQDYKNALGYNKLCAQAKDSLYKIESTEKLLELETKYETEKKELQIKNQSLEIDSQEKENKQKSLIILLGSLALVGSGFFGSVAFINFRKTKKANVIIENQRQEVEHKNTEITHQKELVEEKQKEIIDSINYAQRIQQAVLTGEDVWNKISKENFIVFKPRDIVSGDFYWAHVLPNGRAIFALADCTGHGVPGGFMSMLGNAFLNELVVENKLFKADEILNRLREKVIAALLQKGQSNQKDGMDMALCVWNKMDNTLEFAGANNSLYLVRENELLEHKGDKMPIGTYLEENKKFTAQKIQLQTNDFIYLSTDGFADQFGGPKGKKLKYKKLEQLLIEQSLNSAQRQKQALENAFNEWKSNYEQTDDVSVVGVKVI